MNAVPSPPPPLPRSDREPVPPPQGRRDTPSDPRGRRVDRRGRHGVGDHRRVRCRTRHGVVGGRRRPGARAAAEADAPRRRGPPEAFDRSAGPFDVSEVDEADERLALGGLRLVGREGMELRFEVEEGSGRVIAVTVGLNGSTVQLQAFAAPRSSGVWDEIRAEIAEAVVQQGGAADEQDGPLGRELLCRLPVRTEDGRTAHQRRGSPASTVRAGSCAPCSAGPLRTTRPRPRSWRGSCARPSSSAARRPWRPVSSSRWRCRSSRPRRGPGGGGLGPRRPQPVRARSRDHRGPLTAAAPRHSAEPPGTSRNTARGVTLDPAGDREGLL